MEDIPIDDVLTFITDMTLPPPKVILFDIGGVCVASPFQVILEYELSLNIPPGWINYAISKSGPQGSWSQIERGLVPLDKTFFANFNRDLHRTELWQAFCARQTYSPDTVVPPMPSLDGEWLFNQIFRATTSLDPWMYPALVNLRRDGRYIVGALSNTVIFPAGHALHRGDFFNDPLKSNFDVFVSSAHVGLRKPSREMYRLALDKLDAFARENARSERGSVRGWEDGVKAQDVVFLDDIGENLKAARTEGFRTIKVNLGRAFEAVEELEKLTGMRLQGDHPKVAVHTKTSAKARI